MLLIHQHIAETISQNQIEGQSADFGFERGGFRDFRGSEGLMGNALQIS